jgi:hypothetical protein
MPRATAPRGKLVGHGTRAGIQHREEKDMNKPNPSATTAVNVVGIVVAAAGILMQYFAGAEGFPTIPPGPIILLIAAGVVAFGPWRWTAVVGILAPLFVLIGGTISTTVNWGTGAPLSDPAEVGSFVGALIQFVALLIAVVTGVAAAKQRLGT